MRYKDGMPVVKVHELKTDPSPFQAVWDRRKRFEIRKSDRDFMVGDMLDLVETRYTGEEMKNWAPLEYTGRSVRVHVDHIMHGPVYGLEEGWCIMSISW